MANTNYFRELPGIFKQTNIQQSLLQQGGDQSLGNISSLAVGYGNVAMYADQTGIRLGGTSATQAPFSVDMKGNGTFNNANITGYIQTAGAAGDVNSHGTTVDGGKITANSITAAQIQANTITAGQIASNTITAGQMAANSISASSIQAGAVTASKISVSSLDAINVNAGTLTAGTIKGLTLSMPNESLGTGSSGKLIWDSGARIWGDSSGRIGINGSGSSDGVYIYCQGNEAAVFNNGGQAVLDNGAHLKGNLNVDNDTQINGQIRTNQDNIKFQANGGGQLFSLRNMGLTSSQEGGGNARLDWGNGAFFKVAPTGSNFSINGNTKSAIVPTSKGYNALYCIESPEVWFMDFCESRSLVDPLFLEVTEGEMKFIQCDDGKFQVWRRRKGHAQKRFDSKSIDEFEANERFLKQAIL